MLCMTVSNCLPVVHHGTTKEWAEPGTTKEWAEPGMTKEWVERQNGLEGGGRVC